MRKYLLIAAACSSVVVLGAPALATDLRSNASGSPTVSVVPAIQAGHSLLAVRLPDGQVVRPVAAEPIHWDAETGDERAAPGAPLSRSDLAYISFGGGNHARGLLARVPDVRSVDLLDTAAMASATPVAFQSTTSYPARTRAVGGGPAAQIARDRAGARR